MIAHLLQKGREEAPVTNYISRAEADELCDELIRQFLGGNTKNVYSVDIDGLVSVVLKCPIVYATYAEEDFDKNGFTSDGVTPLRVLDCGEVTERVYPRFTIVLEKYLLRPGEEARRRFTLAHEAGHILASCLDSNVQAWFHRDIDTERFYTAKELHQRMSIAECQANMIAAALLMPRFLLKDALCELNGGRQLAVYGTTVFRSSERGILEKMARRLNVSRTALIIRLRDLGAFQYHDISEFVQEELRIEGRPL